MDVILGLGLPRRLNIGSQDDSNKKLVNQKVRPDW